MDTILELFYKRCEGFINSIGEDNKGVVKELNLFLMEIREGLISKNVLKPLFNTYLDYSTEIS